MDIGTPSTDDQNQVKLNQQTSSGDSNPPAQANPVPIIPSAQNTPAPSSDPPDTQSSQDPSQDDLSSPISSQPQDNNSNAQDTENYGIGKPDIGVELEKNNPPENKDEQATISVSSPSVIPPIDKPSAPEPTENLDEKITTPNPPSDLPTPEDFGDKKDTSNPQTDANPTVIDPQNIPVKSYDETKTTDSGQSIPAPTPPPTAVPASEPSPTLPASPTVPMSPVLNQNTFNKTPQPPVKASGGTAATIVILALLALVLGTGGGFFGFRYYDNMKTSASTLETASPTPTATVSASPSATTKTYLNTLYKYSLKYPSSWRISTEDANAEQIVLASDEYSLAADPSGFRVEINFQASNGKTLKDWVDTNSTTTNEEAAPREITVGGESAYQQDLTNLRPGVATYVKVSDKIMTLTYTAPPAKMGDGGNFYNDIINSINFS